MASCIHTPYTYTRLTMQSRSVELAQARPNYVPLSFYLRIGSKRLYTVAFDCTIYCQLCDKIVDHVKP